MCVSSQLGSQLFYTLVFTKHFSEQLRKRAYTVTMAGRIQPLALVDKCIGSRIWIILKVIEEMPPRKNSIRRRPESLSS